MGQKLTRNPQLGAWTETEKPALFTNKKVQAVAGTTDKLFCEEKRAGFYIESRDPTGDSGLTAFYELMRVEQGLQGQMRLAMKTGMPGPKAEKEPDSPANIGKFKIAFKEITGKDAPIN